MFAFIRLWHRRRVYRPGRIVSRFVAKDIRREIEVVDASELDTGMLLVRSRTWNALYAAKGLSSKPAFGSPQRVAVGELWDWQGQPWGGPVPDGS